MIVFSLFLFLLSLSLHISLYLTHTTHTHTLSRCGFYLPVGKKRLVQTSAVRLKRRSDLTSYLLLSSSSSSSSSILPSVLCHPSPHLWLECVFSQQHTEGFNLRPGEHDTKKWSQSSLHEATERARLLQLCSRRQRCRLVGKDYTIFFYWDPWYFWFFFLSFSLLLYIIQCSTKAS